MDQSISTMATQPLTKTSIDPCVTIKVNDLQQLDESAEATTTESAILLEGANRPPVQGEKNLDNLTADRTDMLTEDNGMSKRIKTRVEIDGVTRWATGSTQQEVILAAAKMLIESGSAIPQNHEKNDAPTFAECAWTWFNVYKAEKVRQNTLYNYRKDLENHILPVFGSRKITEIKASDIQVFLNSKKHLAKSTVHHLWLIVHGTFATALWDEHIDKDPTADAKRYTMSERKTKRHALAKADIKDITENLYRLRAYDKALMGILIYTGARRSEALGLKWSDIDYDENMICINRAVTFKNNHPVIGKTKSEAGERYLPLLPELKEILVPLRQIDGFIIGQDSPITETTYKRTWERINRTIDLHGATAHMFRHTFISRAARRLKPKELQRIAGHADIETTMDIYAHLDDLDDIIEAGKSLKSLYL